MLMIFVLFSYLDRAEKFNKYLSSKHPNINFSLEKENDRHLSFLDINIFREKGKFVTNVYRKNTFSGVYTASYLWCLYCFIYCLTASYLKPIKPV